jgi:hypothetical protein
VPDLPTIEGFSILEELGSGSLYSVFAAVEEPLGRKVALKVLKSTIPPTSPFAAQLEREARVLAELCHPNIGSLHAFSKTASRMHLVLEYVDGFSLSALLKKKPTMPPESVAAIGAAVSRGLSHAHDRGIIHRDIKPATILVGRQGEVKVFDFGVAQRSPGTRESGPLIAMSPLRLEDAASFGTPAYMSPEQILSETVDARSDVFSLGVVLYQLVSGARPFERGDETEGRPAAHRIRRDPPIPLHRRAPDVPPALERIIMRAIEKLPADRYPSADALAVELEELATPASGLRGDRLVMRALANAGVVNLSESGTTTPRRRKRSAERPAILGLALLGVVAIGVGATLQSKARHQDADQGGMPLELVPASPGFIRVLATPWAEVWIDGQRVDVTPFARAIPVAPGAHYVTLVHPRAPADKRTITIAAGETRTIDAVMAVPELPPRDEARAQPAGAEKERHR